MMQETYRRSKALVRQSFRLAMRDVGSAVIVLFMPLVLIMFLYPTFGPALAAEGYRDANGAGQAVPGMAVMFGFFLVPQVGYSFYREHGWHTWERLRLCGVTTFEAFIGKGLVPVALGMVQFVVLFGLGGTLAGLDAWGDLPLLGLVALCFVLTIVALAMCLVAFTRSINQLIAAGNLGALLFAGMGGALSLFGSLPGWAQAVGRWTPGYWAMTGYQSVVLDGEGFRGIAPACGVLLGFAGVFLVSASVRFRVSEEKVAWT